MNLQVLKKANEDRWSKAKFTRSSEFLPVAKRLLKEKTPTSVSRSPQVSPWFVVAVIHEREASGDFLRSIAQGDPCTRVSPHVPQGHRPFRSWYEAAEDALKNCAPYAARNSDGSAGGTLTLLEQYNGLAYANHGVPSPYIWSGTNQYAIGKVLRDHGPIEPVVDKQLGCAGLLLQMQALDPNIQFSGTPVRSRAAPAPSVPAAKATPIRCSPSRNMSADGSISKAH